MGDILSGIYDVPRDTRGRRLSSATVVPTRAEIAEPISITVDLPEAVVGTFDVSNVETEVVESGAYDPSAHTVSEVLAYAAEHPDEVDAIVAAEQSGKQRKMVLSLA